ncbi:hypothetical protein C5167_024601 [Papaver somniferum]|uniref:Neprosin PEP catalytic domain-containing protein n=1 Tax=Papaver somniferum TaxID=3469 RepID=A0A4Y7JT20_PAPSO|nr:hypothetical protein C5167_024601 [Papaver somniferum]
MSISQIWVSAGEHEHLNTVEVGWQVYPRIYGDDHTRFFIYWTINIIIPFSNHLNCFSGYTNGYLSQGCYNLLCDGFVFTFNDDQKDATFIIQKDQSSGHWWVKLQGIPVDYYPSALFTELSKKETSVEWGGEIINEKSKGQHTSTKMGRVFDENNMIKDPENVVKEVTNQNCYDLEIDSDHHGTNGYGFYDGGPGYNDKCQ